MFLKHHLILILIVFIVRIRMESVTDEEYEDNYEDDYSNQDLKQTNENNLDKKDKQEDKQEDDFQSEEINHKNDEYKTNERITNKYDLAKYENLKYENDKNYEVSPNYELIDDYEDDKIDLKDNQKDDLNNAKDEDNEQENGNINDQTSTQLEKNQFRFSIQPRQPNIKKNQVKLVKEIKYPKTAVNIPKHYYPGRNFVHQRSSKNDKKLTKLKVKSDKFVNNDLATLIPIELYKHQVRSRFITNNEFASNSNRFSSRLQELETPQILNGELYCDCGFYLKLKNKKIDKLNSKLKKASKEQKQMKRKLIEMAVKENQLQVICRSQSKANLKYFNKQNGKPGYLALANATSQSKPIDLI